MNKSSSSKHGGGQKAGAFVVLSDDKFQALQKQSNKKPKRTKDDWRSLFALIILCGHFVLIGAVVFSWLTGNDVDSVIKMLSAIGSLLGSPLGFVIGYYYKDKAK